MHAFSPKIQILLLVISPLLCFGQPSTGLKNWLSNNAIAVGQQENESFNFNKERFNGKTIIALGEPTHGTSDAQISRFKLFKFLVKNCGVKLLALEAVSNCEVVNEYLLYGKGTAKSACKQLGMWMYNTTETEKLIAWIRNYNLSKPAEEKIKFYGIDYAMSSIPESYLADSLVGKGILSAESVTAIITANRKSLDQKGFNVEELKTCRNNLKVVSDSISLLKPIIQSKRSDHYFNYISFLCKVVAQTIQAKILGKNITPYYRDSCMAENVRFLSQNNNEQKVFVGGHNAHVRKIENATMGFFLKKIFGDSFYNIGIFTGAATFNAFVLNKRDSRYYLKANEVQDLQKQSLGAALKSAGLNSFYLDFSSADKNSIYQQLFVKPSFNLYAGWLFEPENPKKYFLWDILAKNYDAILYFNQSFSATPIQ
ncbi:erythromycin esterase family protein [Pedobacter sp. GSP4]|uniref:erythromycin esterase family protein n=1 Tax=Pedobacter sp. GSP4 TaxID=3453716 RepID=UPI003EEDA8A3